MPRIVMRRQPRALTIVKFRRSGRRSERGFAINAAAANAQSALDGRQTSRIHARRPIRPPVARLVMPRPGADALGPWHQPGDGGQRRCRGSGGSGACHRLSDRHRHRTRPRAATGSHRRRISPKSSTTGLAGSSIHAISGGSGSVMLKARASATVSPPRFPGAWLRLPRHITDLAPVG